MKLLLKSFAGTELKIASNNYAATSAQSNNKKNAPEVDAPRIHLDA